MKDDQLSISKLTVKQQQPIQCDYSKRVKKNQWNSTESPELNSFNYGQLTSDKRTKTI